MHGDQIWHRPTVEMRVTRRRIGRGFVRLWALVAVCALAAVACSGSDDRGEAIDVLVERRGMDKEMAVCTVDRLIERGIDLEMVGDGAVDPDAIPEAIEAVAACAALAARSTETTFG